MSTMLPGMQFSYHSTGTFFRLLVIQQKARCFFELLQLTYIVIQGGNVADFNNDGYPDLWVMMSVTNTAIYLSQGGYNYGL
jgi:hypothetical protein